MALAQVRSHVLKNVRWYCGVTELQELSAQVKGRQVNDVQQQIQIGNRVTKAISSIERKQWLTGKHFGLALTVCARTGNSSQALILLQKMVQRRISPTLGQYTGVMTACEKANNYTKTIHLFHDMKKFDLTPDGTCFAVYLRCLAHVHGPQASVTVLQQSEFTAHAYCVSAVLSMLQDDYQSAIKLFESTPEEGLNNFCYGAAIGVCARGNAVNDALDLLNRAKENGKGSAAATNAVIRVLGRNGHWQRAIALLDEGHDLDNDTYSMVLQACIQNHQLDASLQLLKRMTLNGIQPGPPTVTDLLTLSSQSQSYSAAKQIIEVIPLQTIQLPSVNAYLSILESEHMENESSNMYHEAVNFVKRWGGRLDDVGSSVLARIATDVNDFLVEIVHIGEVGLRVRAATVRHLALQWPYWERDSSHFVSRSI